MSLGTIFFIVNPYISMTESYDSEMPNPVKALTLMKWRRIYLLLNY